MKQISFFVCAALAMALLPAIAQKPPALHPKDNYYVPSSWGWMQEKWSGNNQPYQKARQELDPILNANKSRPTLIVKVRNQYNRNPKDALALFRWAYVAFWSPSTVNRPELYDILWAFDRTPSPHVYDYTRIHFLVASRAKPDSKLKSAGARLTEHDPIDRVNFLYQATTLSDSSSIDDRKLATRYMDGLCAEAPENPMLISAAGSSYLYLWDKTKKSADAVKAIMYYQKFLKIASPTDKFIPEAKRFTKEMQDALAKSGKTPGAK